MALHTGGWRGDGHRLTRIGVWMAHFALQLQRAGMSLMAERKRLNRGVRLRLRGARLWRRSSDEKGGDYYGSERDRKNARQFHTAPVRICSARYSEARMESERIVIVGF